jgi:hypothetical protein
MRLHLQEEMETRDRGAAILTTGAQTRVGMRKKKSVRMIITMSQ